MSRPLATRHPDIEAEIHEAYSAMSVVVLCADHLNGDRDTRSRLLSAIFHAEQKIEALRDAWREGRYGAEA